MITGRPHSLSLARQEPRFDAASPSDFEQSWELGIDPVVYVTDVLERLATMPSAEIESLTPRNWAAALPK